MMGDPPRGPGSVGQSRTRVDGALLPGFKAFAPKSGLLSALKFLVQLLVALLKISLCDVCFFQQLLSG